MSRILVVDADSVFTSQIKPVLESAGAMVEITDDPRTGTELATSGKYVAALVAAELPGMSGYSVCNRIKRTNGDFKVAIISSGDTPETFAQHQKHKNHADLYLLKDEGAD
ncbi:MAG: response regulator, partial [Deltaproteobacteria bacterium]